MPEPSVGERDLEPEAQQRGDREQRPEPPRVMGVLVLEPHPPDTREAASRLRRYEPSAEQSPRPLETGATLARTSLARGERSP